jgi:ATP-dependent Clp protease ATP-binding subunit ClpX
MGRRPPTGSLACSFCHKSEDQAAKLISSPSDNPRAYICDECIAVCVSILQDDRVTTALDLVPHRLLYHPLVDQFLDAVERWITQESLGVDASEEFTQMRDTAIRMITPGN